METSPYSMGSICFVNTHIVLHAACLQAQHAMYMFQHTLATQWQGELLQRPVKQLAHSTGHSTGSQPQRTDCSSMRRSLHAVTLQSQRGGCGCARPATHAAAGPARLSPSCRWGCPERCGSVPESARWPAAPQQPPLVVRAAPAWAAGPALEGVLPPKPPPGPHAPGALCCLSPPLDGSPAAGQGERLAMRFQGWTQQLGRLGWQVRSAWSNRHRLQVQLAQAQNMHMQGWPCTQN